MNPLRAKISGKKYLIPCSGIRHIYLGSQVAADGGCERDVLHGMNEGYRAWGALKCVLSNRGLGINRDGHELL